MLIDISTFDLAKAITLRDVIACDKLNFKGKPPSLEVVQRYANAKLGYRPIGSSGPRVVLPSVMTGRERLTMPEWVDAFLAEVRRVMLAGCRQGGLV